MTASRDYSAISPSATSLVLLKGFTNIPFAREIAELMFTGEKHSFSRNDNDLAFWKRVVHFEMRYWSVDQLLSELAPTNILELSSGFSFRGLDTIKRKKVFYIDTDLHEVINRKKELLSHLQPNEELNRGTLTTTALNALDATEFMKIIDSFPDGPITIVNEGLLMYLDQDEKAKLCRIIHQVLIKRGGSWITGDIFVKSTLERLNEKEDDSLKELVDKQRIEDNMFESPCEAEKFFKSVGFSVVREAEVEFEKISSLPQLINAATEIQLAGIVTSSEKIQITWCLEADRV